jgi:hypothetical protein
MVTFTAQMPGSGMVKFADLPKPVSQIGSLSFEGQMGRRWRFESKVAPPLP